MIYGLFPVNFIYKCGCRGRERMKRIGEQILDWLYPPRCIFCQQILPIQGERHCCLECRQDLPWNQGRGCRRCGKPLSTQEEDFCKECKEKERFFIQGFGVFRYEGRVQEALYRFKYGGHGEYGKSLAFLMKPYVEKHLTSLPVQLLIPVPLHPRRQKQRGYNQAEEIGKYIGKILGLPLENKVLIRTKATQPQSKLSPMARWNNTKDAFAVLDPLKIKDKFILIIDDIYTTGSTMDACSKTLVEQGAAGVYFLTVSIGHLQNKKESIILKK